MLQILCNLDSHSTHWHARFQSLSTNCRWCFFRCGASWSATRCSSWSFLRSNWWRRWWWSSSSFWRLWSCFCWLRSCLRWCLCCWLCFWSCLCWSRSTLGISVKNIEISTDINSVSLSMQILLNDSRLWSSDVHCHLVCLNSCNDFISLDEFSRICIKDRFILSRCDLLILINQNFPNTYASQIPLLFLRRSSLPFLAPLLFPL